MIKAAPRREFRLQPSLDRGGTEATTWLEAYGAKHVGEIAALMNDPDEQLSIRKEAMTWYARFRRHKALSELERYVKYQVPFDPLDASFRRSLCEAAFEVIKERAPERAYRLSVSSLKRGGHVPPSWALDTINKRAPDVAFALAKRLLTSEDRYVSGASVQVLMQRPQGVQLVAERIADLTAYAQMEAASEVKDGSDAYAQAILFETVKNSDRDTSLQAASAIQRTGLESALPEASLQAYRKLEAELDPSTPRNP